MCSTPVPNPGEPMKKYLDVEAARHWRRGLGLVCFIYYRVNDESPKCMRGAHRVCRNQMPACYEKEIRKCL